MTPSPLRPDDSRPPADPTRRQLLQQGAGLSLLTLLAQGGLLGEAARAAAGAPPVGGPSQMDLFDYKPELNKRHGQTIDIEVRRHNVSPSALLGSQRSFKQHGQTGQWCSDAFPRLSAHMDKLAVIKSLYTDSFAHGSAMLQMNRASPCRPPAMGSG
jgi:hypothetical protein